MMKNNSATINVLRDGNMMKSLVKMGLPMVISMLIMAVYNIADTFWVSHLGTIPIAAVSIVFPFALIFTGVGLTFGVGGGVFVSRLLGKSVYVRHFHHDILQLVHTPNPLLYGCGRCKY